MNSSNRSAVLAGCAAAALATVLAYYAWTRSPRGPRTKFVKVTGLYVYPVKSIKGVPMESIEFDQFGIKGDRRFIIIDEKGKFMSQRKFPMMSQISGATDPDAKVLTLSAPGMEDLTVHRPAFAEGEQHEIVTVDVWGSEVEAAVMPEADEWLQRLFKKPCRLLCASGQFERRLPGKFKDHSTQVVFADGFPQLVVSEASMELLNSKLKEKMSVLRFRPNIVVQGCQPHEEDTWKTMVVHDVVLQGAKLCARCSLPTVDPSTGKNDSDYQPIKTLRSYRTINGDVMFGMNVINLTPHGRLAVGDIIEITEWL